jgi:hypothetical protein
VLAYDKEVFPLRASAACLTIVLCAFGQIPPAQQTQEQPPVEQPADQYFSGTVVSFAAERVTVARTVLGRNSSSRYFTITQETQIEGKLKVKVRVTVQYITKEEVDYAVHIIVRNPPAKK